MTRARPIWIPERVPARITCQKCGLPMQATLSNHDPLGAFQYRCDRCGGETVLSLQQLNDPGLRPKLMGLKAI